MVNDSRRSQQGLWRRVAVVVVLLLASGCAGVLSGASDELVVYSGRSENLIGPLLERFAEERDIAIAVKYGDSSELALLLAEEGERSQADVFLSQSPGATGFLAEQGLLATLDPSVLRQVPARFRNESGRWVGLSGRQRVLVYNTEMVDPKELPDSVFDLAAPRLASQLAVAPENGSFQDFVTAMRQTEGEPATQQWLEAIAEGGARTYANNSAIVEAVGRGEVPFGLVNHYYNERFLAEDPDHPTANYRFAGDDIGALIIPSTGSVLAGSDRALDANELISFLLTREAQRFYSDETFEYPLAAGVASPGDLPPLDSIESPPYDIDQLGGGLQRTVELIDESGLSG
ncbi:MAG: iron ABC transporter substrate-binding protein [Egibacteraceae bacterium]